mmetsp:Transcript_28696/g.40434  ORF Transcript_28696/g.40434 Transcript_28696/m.40434 type:complete len:105 (-) Transcript_28696:77-391(-)
MQSEKETLLMEASTNIFTKLASKRTETEKFVRTILESKAPPNLKNCTLEEMDSIEQKLFTEIFELLTGRQYDEYMVRLEIGNWIGKEIAKQHGGLFVGVPSYAF